MLLRYERLARVEHKKSFLCMVLCFMSLFMDASCPSTTPWSTPINLSNSGGLTSNVFSAATAAGFMAVWADGSNNAHYAFSSDGLTWQSGLVTPAQGLVASASDVFVAGNGTGFMVAWMDSSNNAWSSFSTNKGNSWSAAIQINSTLPLNATSDVYVSGGSAGFVATMIGADNNAYVSFSTGTAAWSATTQVTTDSSVASENQNSQTGRGFVGAVVVGNSCMLTWLGILDQTASAYFSSINPFSSTTVYPLVNVGFLESAVVVAEYNGYFMAVSRANAGTAGQTYFSIATTPSNWATFSAFTTNPANPDAGPWVAANHAGFMSTWVAPIQSSSGSPIWTLSTNNGFNWTPVCSILSTASTTIGGPIALSANTQGFVATWLDSNDLNAYASFYSTPLPTPPTPPIPPATVSAPTLIQGTPVKNVFLTQTERFNRITWSPPVHGIAASYLIYRDAALKQLAATVPSAGPLQYVDYNRQPDKTYTYYLMAVATSGKTSQPVSIAINS